MSPAPSRLQALPIGTIATATVPAGRSLRLRVDTASAVSVPAGKAQSRLAGSMVDFYPVDGHGFRLSAGTKLFTGRDAVAERRVTRGLLTTMRLPSGSPRLGRRRPTPALTMGYTGELARDTSIGVEMGAVRGRGFATVDEMAQHRSSGGGVRPMLNLIVGRRF